MKTMMCINLNVQDYSNHQGPRFWGIFR